MGIPIEFLLERMDINIEVNDTSEKYDIMITSRKKNMRMNQLICKDFLRQYILVFVFTAQNLNPIVHIVSNMLKEMFPHFKKMDIDYSSLEKKYIYP